MKTGWETKNLEEVCEFRRGLTYGKNDEVDFSNNIVLRANNVEVMSGKLDFSELKYINEKIVIPEEKKVKKDTLIICTASGSKSHLGKVAYIDQEYPYAFGGFMGLLIPKQNLMAKFLFYLMLSDVYKEFIGALSEGVNINNLRFDDLGKFLVPIPPLPEQQRIVRILDEAFAGIAVARANAEKNLQNAREVFRSYQNQVFTNRGDDWIETTIDKLSTNLDRKRIPITKSDRKSGIYPYYGASGIVDFVDDYIFDEDTLLISEDGANLLMRSTPIAFSVSGKYWVNNHAHILKFESMSTQKFVEFFLENTKLDDFITGTAQPKLNQEALNSIPIYIPKSKVEQAGIVDRLELLLSETKHLQSVIDLKVRAIDELKQSLLHQAFSGEL